MVDNNKYLLGVLCFLILILIIIAYNYATFDCNPYANLYPKKEMLKYPVWDSNNRVSIVHHKREIHAKQMKNQWDNMNNELSETGRVYFQSHWQPSWSCEFEERIGNFGDGGKWVCDAFALKDRGKECHIISIGSNNEFSFEEAIHNLNPLCKISVLDHTVDNPNPPSYVKYFSLGLGKLDRDSLVTLDTAFEKAGILKNQTVDIVKIDCEGCEYDVYRQFIDTSYEISQILIEIHFKDIMSVHKMFQDMTESKYVIFHKEPNIMHASGNCVEYGFLNSKILSASI